MKPTNSYKAQFDGLQMGGEKGEGIKKYKLISYKILGCWESHDVFCLLLQKCVMTFLITQ